MAKMLARTDLYPQTRRHRGECRCDKSGLFFDPRGVQKIRKRNRARESREFRRAVQSAATATATATAYDPDAEQLA